MGEKYRLLKYRNREATAIEGSCLPRLSGKPFSKRFTLFGDVPALYVRNAQIAIDVGPYAVFEEVVNAGIHSVIRGRGSDISDGPHVLLVELEHLKGDGCALIGVSGYVQLLLKLNQLKKVARRGFLRHVAVPYNVGGGAGNHGVGLKGDGNVAKAGYGEQNALDFVGEHHVVNVGAIIVAEGGLDAGGIIVNLQKRIGVGSAGIGNGYDVEGEIVVRFTVLNNRCVRSIS